MDELINMLNTRGPKNTSKTSTENIERLNTSIQSILNQQIKNELISSQIYRAMSMCLDSKGYVNASKVYFKYANEELEHMNKIYNYMLERNCKALVPECPLQRLSYNSIREIIDESLKHEMKVSSQWEEIAKTCLENKDNTTYEFSFWFLKEQVEEENKFRDLLYRINLGITDWELEELFKSKI